MLARAMPSLFIVTNEVAEASIDAAVAQLAALESDVQISSQRSGVLISDDWHDAWHRQANHVRRDSVSPIDCESPLLGRLFAARGLESAIELDHSLHAGLLRPLAKGIHEAAEIVATAIEAESTILIVGDFDADGATSCALLVSSLKAMG